MQPLKWEYALSTARFSVMQPIYYHVKCKMYEYDTKLCMIHDPCIIQICKILVSTNVFKYIKINLYT
jgi:hypothetical protein